ncbi:MAG TPA: hypothetical protein VFU47_11815, partial [Armatimonadota bacterium]|nr:hypothetical protein [Armatimonadota bacterium]
AHRYRLPDGGRVEFYRAGPYAHDGMRINVYDAQDSIRYWTLVRASGTEALLRVYMEIVEPFENPNPVRLADQFEPLLRYLGLDRYCIEPGQPDYVTQFRETVAAKYCGE